MLQFTSLKSPDERGAYFEKFNSRQSTWVVSDLKSKVLLQDRLLKSQPVLDGKAILRANDLWVQVLTHTDCNFKIISKSLAQSLIYEWLEELNLTWVKSNKSAKNILHYIQHLLPLLAEPKAQELMPQWLAEHPQSLIRWGMWYQISFRIWQRFLEKKWLIKSWAPAYLSSLSKPFTWERPLVFDLDGQLQPVEVELIKKIAEQQEVEVLSPEPEWRLHYLSSLWPYQRLKGQSLSDPLKQKKWTQIKKPESHIHFCRFSTQLAEVKDAVSQIRVWLNEGYKLDKLALLAPNIEEYWPIIKPYLDQEGVPCQKASVTPLQSFSQINQWLSRLRLQSGQVCTVDLELNLFYKKQDDIALDFESFKQLFTKIYSAQDLSRQPDLEKLYLQDFKLDHIYSREEFFAWGLKYWISNINTQQLEENLNQILVECPVSLKLSGENWLSYLEDKCAKIEVEVDPAQNQGLHCDNFSAASHLSVDCIYVVGMTEKNSYQHDNTSILAEDVTQISQDLGFHLNGPDRWEDDFMLRWLLEKSLKTAIISTSMSDFSGNVQAPSLFWLSAQSDEFQTQIKTPGLSRWDELQKSDFKKIQKERAWSDSYLEKFEKTMAQDLGMAELDHYAQDIQKSLSATQLERYLKCPFIFAAEKLFNLSDLPHLDLDMDRMTSGRLMHRLFDTLSKEPMQWSYDDEELEKLISHCARKDQVKLADGRMWKLMLVKYKKIARQFLDFEKSWRDKYPESRIFDSELKFKVYWNEEVSDFNLEKGLAFKGSIDRIDMDAQGNSLIIDYKSTGTHVKNHEAWFANRQIQLALYAYLAHKGLIAKEISSVMGSLYFNVKDGDRDKGMLLNKAPQLQELKPRGRAKITSEGLDQVYVELKNTIKNIVNEMNAGVFYPRPANPKDCPECRWRGLCRSPQLN